MVKKSNNDDKIIGLKKQIAEKKSALKASETFNPKTNCSLVMGFDGSTNIRACTKSQLIELLVRLNSLKSSAWDLGLLNDFVFSGYPIQAWIDDIKARLMIVDRSAEQSRLALLESKLHALLSVDKKIELELEDLSNQI